MTKIRVLLPATDTNYRRIFKFLPSWVSGVSGRIDKLADMHECILLMYEFSAIYAFSGSYFLLGFI